MSRLADITSLIRSKNAGPFLLTIDIMFDNWEKYQRTLGASVVTRERIAALYGVEVGQVELFHHDAAMAIKATIPRPVYSGDLGDPDLCGGQQYAPLVDLEVP